jgi:hypothetical protein
LVIIICCAYRFREKLREEFDRIILLIDEKRMNRNQSKSETVSSELTLKEDPKEIVDDIKAEEDERQDIEDTYAVIQAKKPIYMISQNDVITELKKRIDSMEFKLDIEEPVQDVCDESWRNSGDLQVDLKESTNLD